MLHIENKHFEWACIDLGTGDAKTDINYLHDIFSPNFQYKSILDKRINLIIGSKGTGKTHLMLNLKQEYTTKKNYIVTAILEEESFKIQDLFTQLSAEISGEEINDVVASYARLWDIFILSEAIEGMKNNDSFRRSKKFQIINEYFNVDSEFRIIENIRKLAVGIGEESNNDGIHQSVLKNLGKIITQDDKYQQAREAFKEFLNDEYSGTILLMIDGLDQGISNERGSENSRKLITICKGLYLALGRLKAHTFSSKFHVKACLPNDIFFHFSMRDGDKFERAHAIQLNWNREHLKNTINRRLNAALGLEQSKDTWLKVMPTTIKSYLYNLTAPPGHSERDRAPLDVITEYTFNRPRDMILICKEIILSASRGDVDKISKIEIEDGIKSWSRENYKYLIAEAQFSDERIEIKLASFNGKYQAYKYSKFRQVLSKKDLAMGQQAVDDTIILLYKLGFIGIGIRKQMTSNDDSNTTFYDMTFSFHSSGSATLIGALSDMDTIYFHPALTTPLSLNPGIEK